MSIMLCGIPIAFKRTVGRYLLHEFVQGVAEDRVLPVHLGWRKVFLVSSNSVAVYRRAIPASRERVTLQLARSTCPGRSR